MFPKFKFEAETIEKGALIISGTALLGSLLGLLKNTFLAASFGASKDLDIYFAAFRIPDFLYSLLVFSSLSSSFLPIFSKLIREGKEKVWEFVSSLFSFFVIFFGLASLIVFIFSEFFSRLIAPGFSFQDSLRLAEVLRILMIQPIFLSLANLFSVSLQGFKKFFVSSLAPVFYNLGIILGILFFSNFLGINGVAWGVVLGAVLHLLIQLPSIFSLGFKFSWPKEILTYLKDVGALMLPRSLTILANNFVLFWLTSVSSLMPEGSLSIYNLADSLQSMPVTVFVLALVSAAFPFLSEKWAAFEAENSLEKKQEFSEMFDRVFGKVFFVSTTLASLLAVLSFEAVKLFFGYGNFSEIDIFLTHLTLLVFSLFLPFQALVTLLVRAFFATGDTKTPLSATLVSLFIRLPLIWFFAKSFGVVGLALALGFGFLSDFLILFGLFKKKINQLKLDFSNQSLRLAVRLAGVLVIPLSLVGLFIGFSQNLVLSLFIKLSVILFSFWLGTFLKIISLSELKAIVSRQ